MFGLYYASFENFIHFAENVMRIIYAWPIILRKKNVPNWIEAR